MKKIKNIYEYCMNYKKMKQHISYMVLPRTGEIASVVTFYVNIKPIRTAGKQIITLTGIRRKLLIGKAG